MTRESVYQELRIKELEAALENQRRHWQWIKTGARLAPDVFTNRLPEDVEKYASMAQAEIDEAIRAGKSK